MILNIHSDASYLSETQARSRVAGQFFLGSTPVKGQSIVLNGAIFILCGILKFVVASAAEAELGALFLNCKEGKIIRLILEEMGHIQPPTPVHCDNVTAAGIANDTVKKQRSRSMEMRFFGSWIKLNSVPLMCNGTQDKKTWPIILRSILMASTIERYDHGTSTKQTLHVYYHVHQHQVLCEGVLEIYPTVISVMYRFH